MELETLTAADCSAAIRRLRLLSAAIPPTDAAALAAFQDDPGQAVTERVLETLLAEEWLSRLPWRKAAVATQALHAPTALDEIQSKPQETFEELEELHFLYHAVISCIDLVRLAQERLEERERLTKGTGPELSRLQLLVLRALPRSTRQALWPRDLERRDRDLERERGFYERGSWPTQLNKALRALLELELAEKVCGKGQRKGRYRRTPLGDQKAAIVD